MNRTFALFKERRERIAYSRSFVMSNLSESLKLLFCTVKSDRSESLKSLFKKERMSEEQRERFAHGHKKGGKLSKI